MVVNENWTLKRADKFAASSIVNSGNEIMYLHDLDFQTHSTIDGKQTVRDRQTDSLNLLQRNKRPR